METLKVGELKRKFSRVLRSIQAGAEIIIKYISRSPRPLGLLKGKAECSIKDDFQITDEELLSL